MGSILKSLNINKLLLSLVVFHIALYGQATISVDHNQLNFGFVENGPQTQHQTFFIDNTGTGTINWTLTPSDNWIIVSPEWGIGERNIEVFVDVQGLSPGQYSGTISVTDPSANNSPQIVTVNLNIYSEGNSSNPFGGLDTPVEGSTINGMINVTGWVLDDIEVATVTIYKDVGNGQEYSGVASFVDGARPDVLVAYPDYPNNYQAGWGFMFLTNFSPNGQLILTAEAMDIEGNTTTLGSKTVYIDNANAVKPFGAIDTPEQGGIASGFEYPVWGWVLTPQPNQIPTDGSTINVYIDGVNVGHPEYNFYREDIATLLPGYSNSNGAGCSFVLNTTQYSNGVHTIQWTATDNVGNTDGIGSRYFTIYNESFLSSEIDGFSIPEHLTVINPYPNPFNPSTTINYGISKNSRVGIEVYNLIGDLVATLYNQEQVQGWHSITWNGVNNQGLLVPAGIYLAKITSNNASDMVKLMLLK